MRSYDCIDCGKPTIGSDDINVNRCMVCWVMVDCGKLGLHWKSNQPDYWKYLEDRRDKRRIKYDWDEPIRRKISMEPKVVNIWEDMRLLKEGSQCMFTIKDGSECKRGPVQNITCCRLHLNRYKKQLGM